MERFEMTSSDSLLNRPGYRLTVGAFFLAAIGVLAFAMGIFWSLSMAHADDSAQVNKKPAPRVIYKKNEKLDFSGMPIEGEVRNPGEFYFQHQNEEKFDSLVKRRKNFHREMLRDVVLSK